MTAVNVLADSVGFPILGATSTNVVIGVSRIAITGSAQNFQFPVTGTGIYWKVRVIGTSAEIQCGINRGTAAQAVTLDQASPFGNTSAAAGATLFTGEFVDGIVPGSTDTNNKTFFSWIGRTATGFLEVYCSTCLNTRTSHTLGGV